ncbi:MAG: hypothetical protein UV38_C0002G0086 [candidate division TM6 bacterium GW2011_GWE2_42_60]|nr:MAG: hypothetical protein UV38_C0002G0086 [candidate division TM6 bacterium GW2011_GWE2_42_60]HBY06156.1 hypothetical protein [Candidatus Dependentiae bacterium]
MEVLRILEEKIAKLVQSKKQDLEFIEQLKQERIVLLEENTRLSGEVARLEETVLMSTKNSKELDEEREMAKMAVDELIHNIDSLLEKELQP